MTAPKRRWFSYSLRTMFAVVTVLCVWLGYELKWIRQRRAIVAAFPKWSALEGVPNIVMRQPDAPGLLWLFGERGYATVSLMVVVDDSLDVLDDSSLPEAAKTELKYATALFPESVVGPALIPRSTAGTELEKAVNGQQHSQ